MRTTWRTYVNETDTTVVPDATVDRYLRAGLERLNRRVGYYFKDTSVTIVDGTQEYSLPTDFVKIEFIYWNGQRLNPAGGTDRWIADGEQWTTATGAPEEYVIYGDKLVLYPIPDANSVAADSTLQVRHIATPPDFAANAAAGLLTQDHELPILKAAALWSEAHPGGPLDPYRAANFNNEFEAEAQMVAAIYEARRQYRATVR